MRALAVGILLAAAAFAQEPLHEVCGACHTTAAEDFLSHKHPGVGMDCATCHGPSERHREAAGAAPPDRVAAPQQVAELCGMCHAAQAADYTKSAHGELVAAMSKTRAPNCGTCHDVHRIRPMKSMERRCNGCHRQRPEACAGEPLREAALSCAGCHNPHRFNIE